MRHKVFGTGRLTPLDRNAKAKLAHFARALAKPCIKGQAWGAITPKQLAVFLSLLYTFHNASSGKCFPSYAKIAETTHCAESTVAIALIALERAHLITWQQRLIRTRIPEVNPYGGYHLVTHVVRTSNAYQFDPVPSTSTAPEHSNSEDRGKTTNQVQTINAKEGLVQPAVGLADALSRLKSAMHLQRERKRLPEKEGST